MTTITLPRAIVEQAIALICSARLCEVNSMSSRQEMLRLMIEATDTLRAALAEPVQEPVLVVEKEPDYWDRGHFHQGRKPHIDPTKVWNLPIGTNLYTAPPQRKPLAEWRITDLMVDIDPEDVCSWSFRQGVYAAEKHHGIKP